MATATVFAVYLDGERLGETTAGTKLAAKQWVRQYVLSTHMGEWRRVNNTDWHYHTTIGRTYTFMRIRVS